MISAQNIRFLPVLIIVAMLAFSVRIVDFASGVSSLSGAAQAMEADEKSTVTPADDQKMPDQSGLNTELEALEQAAKKNEDLKNTKVPEVPSAPAKKEDKVTEVSGEKSIDLKKEATAAEDKHAESKTEASVKWRDAGDEEPSTQKTKMEVLKDLSSRRDSLDKKEQELQTREALLRAAEQEIDRKYQELSSLRQQLENLLQKQNDEEKARISSLVKVFENMKPKEAARIFDTLDIPVLMSVMSKMSERKLSPIMASMNPERAKTMTIMLAEEKALPTLPSASQ